MKTLLKSEHEGVKTNGADGCCTRWAHAGRCGGESTAAWLNALGEDSEVYTTIGLLDDRRIVTNGDVRRNWLRGHAHLALAE